MNVFNDSDIFLVTGASSGIGRAIALQLSSAGAIVIANGRDETRLNETQTMASGRIFIEPLDLTKNIEHLSKWLKNLAQKYGRLHGLVYSAGITLNSPLSYYNISQARELFDICCHVPLKLGGAFCSNCIHSVQDPSIVFIAAAAAVEPNPGQGIYAAAKGALISGARCLAREAASKLIRVNCISPGLVKGEMMKKTLLQLGPAFLERETAKYPFGIGLPQNIADMTIFLLSDKANWITGQNFLLTGGSL